MEVRTLGSAIAKLLSPAVMLEASPSIGKIQYAIGRVTLIRADGTESQGSVSDELYAGDALDTGKKRSCRHYTSGRHCLLPLE